MAILRNKIKNKFTTIPNELITDTRISTSARLVYIYLASRPDGWIVRNSDVKNAIGIKNDETIAKYWRELEDNGWIIRQKVSNGIGNGTYDYEILETPKNAGYQSEENTETSEKPKFRKNTDYNNTDSYSNTELNSNTDNNTPLINPPNGENDSKFPFVDKEGRKVIGEDEFGYIYEEEPKPDTCFTFEQFWNTYGKKIGKPKCEKIYAKIKETDRAIIKKQLPKYIAATPDLQYRKHPQTWLNGQCWNDEIINNNRSNNNGTAGSYGRYVPKN